jgi:hypothetical protein
MKAKAAWAVWFILLCFFALVWRDADIVTDIVLSTLVILTYWNAQRISRKNGESKNINTFQTGQATDIGEMQTNNREIDSQIKYCPQCGFKCKADDKYCTGCGYKF